MCRIFDKLYLEKKDTNKSFTLYSLPLQSSVLIASTCCRHPFSPLYSSLLYSSPLQLSYPPLPLPASLPPPLLSSLHCPLVLLSLFNLLFPPPSLSSSYGQHLFPPLSSLSLLSQPFFLAIKHRRLYHSLDPFLFLLPSLLPLPSSPFTSLFSLYYPLLPPSHPHHQEHIKKDDE